MSYILELLDIQEQVTEFWFRKLKSITIYNAYSNKSSFKYYISILGGMGGQRSLDDNDYALKGGDTKTVIYYMKISA